MYDLRQTKKLKPEGISLSAIIVDITPNSEYANFNFFQFQTNSNRIWDVKNWPKHQHNYAMCMSQAAHLRRYACSNQHSKKKKKLRKIENMFVLGKKVLEFFPVSSRTFITSFIGIILSAHTIIAGIEKHVVLLLAIIT